MKHKNCYWLLLALLPGCVQYAQAQSDSVPAVWTVYPTLQDSFYNPVTEPYFYDSCANYVWLAGRPFDLTAGHFLPDSDFYHLLKMQVFLRVRPSYQYTPQLSNRWLSDQETDAYYWSSSWRYRPKLFSAGEYNPDTKVHYSSSAFTYLREAQLLCRYDRQHARCDSFEVPFRSDNLGIEFGLPGLWLTDQRTLVLIDRVSGQVLSRTALPDTTKGDIRMRPWGDNLIIDDKWLYQRAEGRFVPFFPLPTAVEGCRSPLGTYFCGPICVSSLAGENPRYSHFLTTPDHVPIQLPFAPNVISFGSQTLAFHFPIAWFYFPDHLLAYDITTGDSTVYPQLTTMMIPGDQRGRFFGFKTEAGLCFFDTYTCQFRLMDFPGNYDHPRNFTSDERYLYLTYGDCWQIVRFSGLDTVYRHDIAGEFQAFQEDCLKIQKDLPKDFYAQYTGYLKIYQQYKNNANPRITAAWPMVKTGVHQALFEAGDSLMGRITADHAAGYFDPSFSPELSWRLLEYFFKRDSLEPAVKLIKSADYAQFKRWQRCYFPIYPEYILKTQHCLDSLSTLQQTSDERLYALGKTWWDYSFNIYGDSPQARQHFSRGYAYYRALLERYPNSPWIDDAIYDTLYHANYFPQAAGQESPSSENDLHYLKFKRFVQDYPQSEHGFEMQLRLAELILFGVQDEDGRFINREKAIEYLRAIPGQDSIFDKRADLKRIANEIRFQDWIRHWQLSIQFDREQFNATDTIWVTLQMQNKSGSLQSLDTAFLNHWTETLPLQIFQERPTGCEAHWGIFQLLRTEKPLFAQPVTVAAGAAYTERFFLPHRSGHKIYASGDLNLTASTYSYSLEYHNRASSLFYLIAPERGKFTIN